MTCRIIYIHVMVYSYILNIYSLFVSPGDVRLAVFLAVTAYVYIIKRGLDICKFVINC